MALRLYRMLTVGCLVVLGTLPGCSHDEPDDRGCHRHRSTMGSVGERLGRVGGMAGGLAGGLIGGGAGQGIGMGLRGLSGLTGMGGQPGGRGGDDPSSSQMADAAAPPGHRRSMTGCDDVGSHQAVLPPSGGKTLETHDMSSQDIDPSQIQFHDGS